MVTKILCFIGFHDFTADSYTDGSFRAWVRCVDCDIVKPVSNGD